VGVKSVWKGPYVDGVTQTHLQKFLECRERFRLYMMEGLTPTPIFNRYIEYGNFYHLCDDAMSKGSHWDFVLGRYAGELLSKYPSQQNEILRWVQIFRRQYPLYLDYWDRNGIEAQTLLSEHVFDVQYILPSGRTVRLRGKWDGVYEINNGVWLWETKTKGEVDIGVITKQLTYDLQTMFYIVALLTNTNSLEEYNPFNTPERPLRGIYYNVIRRPLSGGLHSIKQYEPSKRNPRGESDSEFYARLEEEMVSDPEYFFHRWQVVLSNHDVARFRRQCLDPILESLCDWWEHISSCYRVGVDNFYSKSGWSGVTHLRTPYGLWNSLADGGMGPMDEFLNTGSDIGLERTDNLFPELT
jgi:hypothetical protein